MGAGRVAHRFEINEHIFGGSSFLNSAVKRQSDDLPRRSPVQNGTLLNTPPSRTSTASHECRNDLYRLSFQLTGDHDKAEQCFVAGRDDCVKAATRVFKEWARSWTKRTVIQNAIRELKPRPGIAGSSWFTVPTEVGESPSDGDTR